MSEFNMKLDKFTEGTLDKTSSNEYNKKVLLMGS